MGRLTTSAQALALGVVLTLLVAGCASPVQEPPTTAGPPLSTATPVPVTIVTEFAPSTPINVAGLANATEVFVWTPEDSWDGDAAYDGVAVSPWLQDDEERTIAWSGPALRVAIEIWTTRPGPNLTEEKDRLVYRGEGTIDAWKDTVRVPFEEMETPPGERFGLTYVTVYLPDGRALEGRSAITALGP